MRSIPSNQNELSWWLSYIDSISAREVELGLDRVGQVAEKLGIQTLAKNTIVVAGTNGKGSCIAVMESILKRVGCNVGTYTSPHIARFSERIKLNGVEVVYGI
jgi:dihydrofolate synthase/folylpolyglutamate synthase